MFLYMRSKYLRFGAPTFFLLLSLPAFAGNGRYYGIDGIVHHVKNTSDTSLVYNPPPPAPSLLSGSSSDTFADIGFRFGYKYKRRKTHNFFLAPEIFMSTVDMEHVLYSTTLKMGREFNNIAAYGGLGISRTQQFKTNEINFTLGMDYKITDRWSFNLEWIHFDTIKERSSETQSFVGQTLTTTTDTERQINALKLGITYYLHE